MEEVEGASNSCAACFCGGRAPAVLSCCSDCPTMPQERWLAFVQQKVTEWQKGLRFEPKQGA